MLPGSRGAFRPETGRPAASPKNRAETRGLRERRPPREIEGRPPARRLPDGWLSSGRSDALQLSKFRQGGRDRPGQSASSSLLRLLVLRWYNTPTLLAALYVLMS